MAVPKKRTSHTKGGMRRAHQAISAATTTKCAHCGKTKLSHTVCPSCGYYRGRKVAEGV